MRICFQIGTLLHPSMRSRSVPLWPSESNTPLWMYYPSQPLFLLVLKNSDPSSSSCILNRICASWENVPSPAFPRVAGSLRNFFVNWNRCLFLLWKVSDLLAIYSWPAFLSCASNSARQISTRSWVLWLDPRLFHWVSFYESDSHHASWASDKYQHGQRKRRHVVQSSLHCRRCLN